MAFQVLGYRVRPCLQDTRSVGTDLESQNCGGRRTRIKSSRPSAEEAEAGRALWAKLSIGLHGEFQTR